MELNRNFKKWGSNSYIRNSAHIGENFQIGHNSIILDNVTIGDNVRIGSFCILKPGTVLADGVFFDDYCISSGENYIGEGCQIRYQSIIARNVRLGKHVFFCAGVKTAYLTHERTSLMKEMIIEDNVFVGDNATILSGLRIAKGSVIGAHALVTRDCTKEYGVYIGVPAKISRLLDSSEIEVIENITTIE